MTDLQNKIASIICAAHNIKPSDVFGRLAPINEIIEVCQPQWISVSDRLPEDGAKCIVQKQYDFKRKESAGHFFETELLVFNGHHECWDDEDGDDFNCKIEQVTHWQPLPTPPTPPTPPTQ